MLKESTLRNQLDFKVVYNKGKSKVSRFMVIIYKKNGLKYSRLAYVSSKKVGNSVRRNRSRRLMREAYRLLGCEVKNGYDVIFIARNSSMITSVKKLEGQCTGFFVRNTF